MSNIPIQITDQPIEAEWRMLEDNSNRLNIQQTGYNDYRPLAMFIRDTDGTIIAGLTGFTWGGTLRILFLWAHENWRRHGYGTHLLAAAEHEARTRGCKPAVVDTHSFQAPQFYPQRGYVVCGVTSDNPIGYQHITFQKRLIE